MGTRASRRALFAASPDHAVDTQRGPPGRRGRGGRGAAARLRCDSRERPGNLTPRGLPSTRPRRKKASSRPVALVRLARFGAQGLLDDSRHSRKLSRAWACRSSCT